MSKYLMCLNIYIHYIYTFKIHLKFLTTLINFNTRFGILILDAYELFLSGNTKE